MDNAPKESASTAATGGAQHNTSDINSNGTGEREQAIFTAYRSHLDTQPRCCLTQQGLADKARNPTTGAKADAAVIVPHTGRSKRKADAEASLLGAIVVDHDDGNVGRDEIATYYAGTAHIAFTTSSHLQDSKGQRWKVVLPLAEPLDVNTWTTLALGAAEEMGGDKAQARVQQVFYAPNKISADAPYECLIDLDSPCLAPDDALGEQFMEAGREIQAQQAATASTAAIKGGGGSSPAMQRINARIDVADVLERNGYSKAGNRWLSPVSESGTPGVVLLDGDDKPRIYSHHGSEDALSALNHNGHALDALDVVATLEHNGDIGAAQAAHRAEYSTLKAEAGGLDADSDPETVAALAAEASQLSKLETRSVFNTIKKSTGFSLADLRAAVSEHAPEKAEAPDHRDLALRVIRKIGEVDLIADDANLWRYRAGVWRPLSPRDERHTIHKVFAETGIEIKKAAIDGTADAVRNELYRPRHAWNIGNPEAVSCRNGLLVLDGGQWHLAPHRREDYRTSQIPLDYDPSATAPRFEQFLCEIFDDDPDALDKIKALLELIGYTLVAHARFEKFIILVGEGGNGKSKVLKLIETLCGGENTTAVQPAEMRNKFQRAALHLKLANLVSEVPEGSVFPDAELKAITSGELATVEHKFGTPFEIAPYATCWFGTNHMPSTRDFSEGTFRRAWVFKFNNTFKEGVNADPKLDDKLRDEAAGALNMALAAYAAVVHRGYFTEPDSCAQAKREWRLEADQVARFVEERCGQGEHVRTATLYDSYEDWARETGIKNRLGMERFIDRVKRLGYETGKLRGNRGVFGISCEPTPGHYFTASRGY